MKRLKIIAIILLIISLISFFVIGIANEYKAFLKEESELIVYCAIFFILAASIILFSIYNFKIEKKTLAVLLFLIVLSAFFGAGFMITIKLLGFI